jgi:hypothetical protein
MDETKFTAAFLAEQRELAEKATERPWISNWDQPEDSDKLNQIANADGVDVIGVTYYDGELLSISKEDAAYTVAAANHYPAALDAIERLRAENERLRARAELRGKALIALREWLWSGKLDPKQKAGAPILVPQEVADTVCAALETIDEKDTGQP